MATQIKMRIGHYVFRAFFKEHSLLNRWVHHQINHNKIACVRKLHDSALMRCRTFLLFPTRILEQPSGTFLKVVQSCRTYAKRGKSSAEEFSNDNEEEEENAEDEFDDFSLISKTVPSLRLDTLLKAGLNLTKKKIEKEFYNSNIRVNGEAAVKKAYTVQIGDEIDLVVGHAPESERLLQVDRVILKSVGKVTGTGYIAVKVQIFKSLTIENYENRWTSSDK